MRIESLRIHGFGRLANRQYDFPQDRAVLVLEDNEAGKSTLAAAIMAGLCGFPSRKTRGELMKLSEVHRPWGGGPYGLEMVVEAAGRRYEVERDFARGTFVARDAETGRDVSAQLDPDLPLHFLKLGREDLARVAFISGKEVGRFDAPASLKSRLSSLVEGSSESGAEAAIAALDKASCVLDCREIKIETAIARLTKSIDEKRRRLQQLDSELDAVEQDVRALDECRARQTELSAKLAELDTEYRLARLRELTEQIEAAEANADEILARQAETEDLQPYAAFPIERRDQLSRAMARLAEREAQVQELSARSREIARRADELNIRLEELKQLSTATSEDLVALRATEDSVRSAAEACERTRMETGDVKRSPARMLSIAAAVLGIATGLVCVALMVVGTAGVVASAVGAVAGVAVGAAGLVQAARLSGRRAATCARMEQAQDLLAEAHRRAGGLLSALGMPAGRENDVVAALARAGDALSRYLRERDSLRTLQQESASIERDLSGAREAVREEGAAIASILSYAGIDATLPRDRALLEFDAAEGKHRRWREIRDTLLPALRAHSLPSDALGKLEAEASALKAGLCGDGNAVRSSSEVDAERQGVRAGLDEAATTALTLDRRVGRAVDAYRAEYRTLQEDLSGLEADLSRIRRFGRAVGMAADVLRQVAEGTRRRWAAALNERAGAILRQLNPNYADLRFDESLDFTVRHVPDGQVVERSDVDARLSTGAKDQVYLAVRLACCMELSAAGEAIPVMLDDPLIAFDDSRFGAAMRYLVDELAARQQVIILSCHRSRHSAVFDEPWFREGISVISVDP